MQRPSYLSIALAIHNKNIGSHMLFECNLGNNCMGKQAR